MQIVDCGFEYQYDELPNREGMKRNAFLTKSHIMYHLLQFRAGSMLASCTVRHK